MTALDLLRVAVTRWYVVLVGLAFTAFLVHTATPDTVYYIATQVTVVRPRDELKPLTLEDVPPDAVPAATLLAQVVNGGHAGPKSVSPDVTLYGEGKRDTAIARVRDVGGQWGSQVLDPVFDIQVVDDDPTVVKPKLASEIALLSAQLGQLQDSLKVVPSQRLKLVTPLTPPEMSTITGSKIRAWAGSILVGLFTTVAALYWSERLAGWRRRRRSRASRDLVLVA